MTDICFMVPTLNRGRYVVRSVQSCLETGDAAGVSVKVVVLDSQSDDGSWEALKEAYGDDTRVLLLQNQRGLGPTKSWLDAAVHADATYATFVWSDDYLSPRMASRCLAEIGQGDLVIGDGMMRDIDDESPLPTMPDVLRIDCATALAGYFGLKAPFHAHVSPLTSLFSRRVLAAWYDHVEHYCQSSELRRQILWRRAIGPDVMLYLTGLSMQDGPTPVIIEPLAQFSRHTDSITISTSSWTLDAGYFMAHAWCLKALLPGMKVAPKAADALFAKTLLRGLKLLLKVPAGLPIGDRPALRRAMRTELSELWAARGGWRSLAGLAAGTRSTLRQRLSKGVRV